LSISDRFEILKKNKIKYAFLSALLLLNSPIALSQLDSAKLSQPVQLNLRLLLEIELDVLASRLSSGSYTLTDQGNIGRSISIKLDEHQRIRFDADMKFDRDHSPSTELEIMRAEAEIIVGAISNLLEQKFKQIGFNKKKDIIGYWNELVILNKQ
jgi:hypothetical protein